MKRLRKYRRKWRPSNGQRKVGGLRVDANDLIARYVKSRNTSETHRITTQAIPIHEQIESPQSSRQRGIFQAIKRIPKQIRQWHWFVSFAILFVHRFTFPEHLHHNQVYFCTTQVRSWLVSLALEPWWSNLPFEATVVWRAATDEWLALLAIFLLVHIQYCIA